MENNKPEPDLTKIHKVVEAALTKVHDAQSDNYDPSKTKEDMNRDLFWPKSRKTLLRKLI
jgi:hypothetical protein